MTKSIIPQPSDNCITCGNELTGNFCANCGEKKLNPSKDYSIGKFLEQTVDGFTHFDSKFLRSFKALLFKPGLLTSEFINGRRTRYMKPVQVFIIAGVLFYFFFPRVSTFYASVSQLEMGGKFEFNATRAVEEKATSDKASTELIIKEVETEASHKSKTYLFLIIPFWGLFFYALFFRSNRFLVPHIIFSAHNLSFLIILFMVYYLSIFLIGLKKAGDTELIPMAIIYLIYLFLAIRKVYQQNIFWSTLKTIISFAALMFLFIVYREGITIWTLTI